MQVFLNSFLNLVSYLISGKILGMGFVIQIKDFRSIEILFLTKEIYCLTRDTLLKDELLVTSHSLHLIRRDWKRILLHTSELSWNQRTCSIYRRYRMSGVYGTMHSIHLVETKTRSVSGVFFLPWWTRVPRIRSEATFLAYYSQVSCFGLFPYSLIRSLTLRC
jgi:hypothetical protein